MVVSRAYRELVVSTQFICIAVVGSPVLTIDAEIMQRRLALSRLLRCRFHYPCPVYLRSCRLSLSISNCIGACETAESPNNRALALVTCLERLARTVNFNRRMVYRRTSLLRKASFVRAADYCLAVLNSPTLNQMPSSCCGRPHSDHPHSSEAYRSTATT